MNLTQQERAALIRRSARAWSYLQEDLSAQELLQALYCGSLADKSPQQGGEMAQELLLWMARFQDCYDGALRDPQGCPEALEAALAPLPPEQRNQILAQLSAAGEAAAPDRLLPPEDGAAARNRRRVNAAGELVLAVNAMTLYAMGKRGELSGLPRDASLAQTTLCLCAEDLTHRIRREAQTGRLSQRETDGRKNALSAAFQTTALLAGAALAGGFTPLLAGSGGVFGCLSAAAALLAALGKILEEKFQIDAQMLEELPENLREIPLALPRAARRSGGQASRLQRAAPKEPEDLEQAQEDESSLWTF